MDDDKEKRDDNRNNAEGKVGVGTNNAGELRWDKMSKPF